MVRIVALICLTAIVLACVAGLTIVACVTDRSLLNPERFTLVIALCVALLGGMSVFPLRRHRWRVEREDVNGVQNP